jgi:flagellar capping protein FliD
METLFTQIIEASPILGIILVFWFYQRKDYREFVDKVQEQNAEREKNYQSTIEKLTEKFNIVETVKTAIENVEDDVKEIKDHIFNK